MTWESVTAALTALATLYGLLRKAVNGAIKGLRTFIQAEMSSHARDIKELREKLNSMSFRQEEMLRAVNQAMAQSQATHSAIKDLREEIRDSRKELTERIDDLSVTKAEWITAQLIRIKGDKK